jgi:acetyl esterase/lipase
MVDYAAYFHSKLISNTLTGLPLSSAAVANNIGLLGHSVGAGLATYVAKQAATDGRPFKAVMYMAPQTEVCSKVEIPSSSHLHA